MQEHNSTGRSWLWLLGGLCFVMAWLAGAVAPGIGRIWNWQTIGCLCLTSICWGMYGWERAGAEDASREGRAFHLALWVIVPWLAFLLLMLIPYAAGIRQR
jgi:hypothetical protein